MRVHVLSALAGSFKLVLHPFVDKQLGKEHHHKRDKTDTKGQRILCEWCSQTLFTQGITSRLQQMDKSSSHNNSRSKELGNEETPWWQSNKGVSRGQDREVSSKERSYQDHKHCTHTSPKMFSIVIIVRHTSVIVSLPEIHFANE
ncbi:hypothetical protein OGAPHI_005603 [Ogataea philodendri]|uniref:Uncharacterized protein n=1 Tax=Ogataea philodendri TaxID=1378263 RepID=A0A9P8NZX4_9ASCO|nr:uncharacterized protein OGAPHI_005603 [Ogataea philodendri]KAH3662351.1 hypothetical protein OGAPHI_005603 [Ogataea philodendri]